MERAGARRSAAAREPGSEKYEAAAKVAEWQGTEPRHVADLLLRAAWCCVDEGDIEAERFFRRKAAWKFEEALERFDGVARDERAVLTYLVGELWRRVGDAKLAADLVQSRGLGDRGCADAAVGDRRGASTARLSARVVRLTTERVGADRSSASMLDATNVLATPTRSAAPSARSEQPIAGVAKPGQDVPVLVELAIERGAVHDHIGMRLARGAARPPARRPGT